MTETVYLAGGCFWGTQRYFDCLPGVVETRVGYANGSTENPSYEQVKSQRTGHAETVEVRFDPERISLEELLEAYYAAIDPCSVDRQGADVGVQYRTGIYTVSDEQLERALLSLDGLRRRLGKPLAVECRPLEGFWPAEAFHQKYLEKNPAGYCHLPPALFEAARHWKRPEA